MGSESDSFLFGALARKLQERALNTRAGHAIWGHELKKALVCPGLPRV